MKVTLKIPNARLKLLSPSRRDWFTTSQKLFTNQHMRYSKYFFSRTFFEVGYFFRLGWSFSIWRKNLCTWRALTGRWEALMFTKIPRIGKASPFSLCSRRPQLITESRSRLHRTCRPQISPTWTPRTWPRSTASKSRASTSRTSWVEAFCTPNSGFQTSKT